MRTPRGPCIAVHYLAPNPEDIEPLILSLLATYPDSRTFSEFHQFVLIQADKQHLP